MKRNSILISAIVVILAIAAFWLLRKEARVKDDRFISYTVDPATQDLKLYWRDERDNIFGSIGKLRSWLAAHKKELVFAMNGGMYRQDRSPQGLYIENGITLAPLDTANGNGNFYLKPNGVFYIRKDSAAVCTTNEFINDGNIRYATQSGPMLVINGNIHHAFQKGSTNLNIRNGVGILPDNRVVFAMCKEAMNLYDFANYFKALGCRNALYLDGFVSRTYLPEKNWLQTDGDFGVMVGVTSTTK